MSHQVKLFWIDDLIKMIKSVYKEEKILLHRPVFEGNEKRYLTDCIDSNYVSSVGNQVSEFEQGIAAFTGSRFAIATVNGTAALHVCFKLAGISQGDEVICQSVNFIASCNAVTYAGGTPVFIDVDIDTLGMSPKALNRFLNTNVELRNGIAWNRITNRKISACVPMHTFGLPCRIQEIREICQEWSIPLVEDAAESLGCRIENKHTGTFGLLGAISFNGNKILTTGGGGMILTNDEQLAKRAKHITTTAKLPHPYKFIHDEIGFNYRLPNLNAALGLAQLELLPQMLMIKGDLNKEYASFFSRVDVVTPKIKPGVTPWLNTIILNSIEERDYFINYTNERNIMTRPMWNLMSKLEMYKDCQNDGLTNSLWLEERVVNLPSSVPYGILKKIQ
jgi:aminotransferase in exopolysaccharide biosynthesis